ncbi:MAG: TetR/AcrR family transcriptional regulator [Pseudomonadota bacterium]
MTWNTLRSTTQTTGLFEGFAKLPKSALSETQTRELILEEAYTLFTDIGYRKTTMGDIAKACGFSAALVHKHFGTKSAVNQAIASVMMEEMLTEARGAITRHRSAAHKLRTFIKTIYQGTLERFQHKNKVFETLSAAAEEKWEVVRAYRQDLYAIVHSIIEEGNASGEFNIQCPDRTTKAVHMALTRVFHPVNIVEMIGEPDEGDVDDLVDFILVGLGKT